MECSNTTRLLTLSATMVAILIILGLFPWYSVGVYSSTYRFIEYGSYDEWRVVKVFSWQVVLFMIVGPLKKRIGPKIVLEARILYSKRLKNDFGMKKYQKQNKKALLRALKAILHMQAIIFFL